MEARQLGDDILREAVRKELLLGFAAHVEERQHGYGWLFRACCRNPGILPALRRDPGVLLNPNPEHPNWARDILDALLTKILKYDVLHSGSDLIAYGTRNTNTIRLGERFQTR